MLIGNHHNVINCVDVMDKVNDFPGLKIKNGVLNVKRLIAKLLLSHNMNAQKLHFF
jgi:hypothetical protein